MKGRDLSFIPPLYIIRCIQHILCYCIPIKLKFHGAYPLLFLLFDLIIKKENKEEERKTVDKLKTYEVKILSFRYQLLLLSFTQYDSILKVSVSVF